MKYLIYCLLAIMTLASCIQHNKTTLKVISFQTNENGMCRYYITNTYADELIYFIDSCGKYKIGDILK